MDGTGVTVNGRERALAGVAPHESALDWLRGLGLTGAKEGCAEGECGACAVLVATADAAGGAAWTPVNACLVPALSLDGQELVTAEGLGTPDAPHPVQAGLAAAGGSQCGYCTPGFACSMAAEFYRADRAPQGVASAGAGQHATGDGHPHEHEGEHGHEHGPNGFELVAIGGNLCRCTGYRPIRDAAYALGEPAAGDPLAHRRTLPPPPAVLTDVTGRDGRYVRPATLDTALRLLRDEPGAVAVAGATDWGVDVNLRARRAPVVVAIDRLAELQGVTIGDTLIEIGGAATLSEIERALAGQVPLLAELMPQFASRLIRNRATLGGNLGTASPIGDASPVLLALGARVVLAEADPAESAAGIRERELDLADYFTGYRTTARRPAELIRAIRVPLPVARLTAFHKIAKRRFDDISSVAVAFALEVDDGVVTSARIGLGGVAATPLRAIATERALVGRPWDAETVRAAASVLGTEGTPQDDQRASAAYRAAVLGRALLKLHAETGERP